MTRTRVTENRLFTVQITNYTNMEPYFYSFRALFEEFEQYKVQLDNKASQYVIEA